MADFPDEGRLADTLLMLVQLAGGYIKTPDAYEPLAKFHKISEKALSLKTATGASKWHTMVRSARERLAKHGFVPRPVKKEPTSSQRGNKGRTGWWQLTPNGVREADKQLTYLGTSARLHLEQLAKPIEERRILDATIFGPGGPGSPYV